MEEIEVVINITKHEWEYLNKLVENGDQLGHYERLLVNGKPLPKGHGRIGDLDALRCENADFDTYNDYCTMFDEIEAAETIIEADKAESEDKE